MTLGFGIMSMGPREWIAWIVLPIFPLAMSLLGPIICSLISQESGSETGKFLGLNQSAMSIAHIIGPIFSGLLYSRGHLLPFISSTCIFGFLFLAHILYYKIIKKT
jgi:predicted MFS family arabinose efflux permease